MHPPQVELIFSSGALVIHPLSVKLPVKYLAIRYLPIKLQRKTALSEVGTRQEIMACPYLSKLGITASMLLFYLDGQEYAQSNNDQACY